MFTREATKEEIRNAYYVNSIISIDEIVKACEIIGDYVLSYGAARKINYNKAYRLGKRIGATVPQLVDWYTTDIY